ncbi:integrase core domain-containing protein, partial [Rhodovulum sulfidophilum]|uniref:integrase core domain-containing protein n=1 Tax=Rhodovulum sulfidophilum TaxID=35806 RepID=UPI001F489561
RSLYCCSDGVRGRGAAMTNLSHSASFHSNEWIAPSNHGIKQLGAGKGHRNELLNGEIFYSLAEARVIIEAWRGHYNTVRPRSSPGYRPPAPEAKPLRLMKIIPPTHADHRREACCGTSENRAQGAQSARRSARKYQTCDHSVFTE